MTENQRQTIWFYGWVIVAVAFVSLTVTFGIRLSFSVFFVALIDDFGWLRADTSLIFSLNMVVFATTSTIAGLALDRWGVRLTFGFGALLLALGLWLSSQIQTFWQLALTYGVVSSLGITVLGLGPQASIIARWFRRRRGLAIGIAFSGTGIGTLLITPGIEYLITLYGWRVGYTILALLSLVTVPIIVLLMRQNPGDLNLQPNGTPLVLDDHSPAESGENWEMAKVIRTPAFWMLLVSAVGAIGPIRMLTVHQMAIMVDAGFPRAFAAQVIGGSGAVTALAFIVLGALSDHVGRRLVYSLGALSLLTAMVILAGIQGLEHAIWLIIFAILLGFGEGSRSSLVTAVASDLFPGDALGAINGTIGAAFGIGAAFFPWFAGLIFDAQGSYRTAFVLAGITVLVSAITLTSAPLFKKAAL